MDIPSSAGTTATGNSSAGAAQRRRGRTRQQQTPSVLGTVLRTVGTVTATALVAYGTYEAIRWFWNSNSSDTTDSTTEAENGEESAYHNSQKQRQNRNILPSRRFLKCQPETVNSTFRAMLPLLRRRIDALTDISEQRRQLKAIRQMQQQRQKKPNDANDETTAPSMLQQQDALWMTIQIESLTRWIANVYAYVMLYTVLTIQVHLLLGHEHRRSLQSRHEKKEAAHTDDGTTPLSSSISTSGSTSSTSATNTTTASTHETVVLNTTFDYFWDHGLEHVLVPHVRLAVTRAVADWHLTNTTVTSSSSTSSSNGTMGYLSEFQFNAALVQIRSKLDGNDSTVNPIPNDGVDGGPLFLKCFIRPDSVNVVIDTAKEGDAAATTVIGGNHLSDHCTTSATTTNSKKLLDETYDILESPVAIDAVQDGLDVLFRHVQNQFWSPLFTAGTTTTTTPTNGAASSLGSTAILLPLAPVIAQTKAVTNSLFTATAATSGATNGSNNANATLFAQNTSSSPTTYIALLQHVPTLQEAAHVSFGDVVTN